jgi:formate-dependent nitrite reductase membrane component NrfD
MNTDLMETNAERLPVDEHNIPESFEVRFIPQSDWKLKELLAFYLGGVGTGLYVISQFMNFTAGLVIGFILVVFGKNLAHLVSASRPTNAFRAFARPGTSWISRGVYFIIAFTIFGALDIASRAGWIEWGGTLGNLLSVLAFVSALLVMIYLGFLMAGARIIPLWHSPLIPAIFLSYSLAFGGALAAILYPISGIEYSIASITKLLLLTIASTLFLILVHLMVMKYSNKAAKRSAELLIRGNLRKIFVGGVLIVGLVIPLIITGLSQVAHSPTGAGTVIAGVLMLIGGFLFESSFLKAAIYTPLIDVE